MIRKILAGVLLASLAVTAIAPATVFAGGEGTVPGKNIVERAIAVNEKTGKFDTLIAAATCEYLGTAVVDVLTQPTTTLFAPTDAAFKRLGRALGVEAGLNPDNVCTVDSLLGDGTLLKVLGYHVIDEKVPARKAIALAGTKVKMVLGGKAKITLNNDVLRIDGAKVIKPGVHAKNGVIHVINKVMTPPSLG